MDGDTFNCFSVFLTELDALLNLDKHESDTIGEEDEDREEDTPERSTDEYER